jgi:cyclopropane fatty-acyl-phospholipid synthase-like methyltransferase
VIDDPREVEQAYARQYENLSREFSRVIQSKRGILAEIGCGRGQLTIPVARLLPHCRFRVVDTFAGAYTGTLRLLNNALLQARLKNRVKVYKADYLAWLWDRYSDSYAGVVSSEFLPEIDSYELSMFLSECYRVVRPGGITVHSFLSPSPRNRRQRLLIEADTDPIWTKTPPKEWFSPKPTFVVSKLMRIGFRGFHVKRVKSNLIIRGEAARSFLQSWDVKSTFWKTRKVELVSEGLEVPDWVIISGRKP